jgi:hypothetical protein
MVSHDPIYAGVVRTVFFEGDCWFVAVDVTELTGVNLYPSSKGAGKYVKSEMVIRPSGSLSKTKIVTLDGVRIALRVCGKEELIKWFEDTYQRDLATYRIKEKQIVEVRGTSTASAEHADQCADESSQEISTEAAVGADEGASERTDGLLSDLAECKQAIALALSMLDEIEMRLLEQLSMNESPAEMVTTSDEYVRLSDMTDIGVRRVYAIARKLGVIGSNYLVLQDSKGGAFAIKVVKSRNGKNESFLAANKSGIAMLKEGAAKW